MSMSCSSFIPDVLSRINEFLSDRNESGKYATVFYSVIDRDGLLTYVNAGHCPPVLVTSQHELRALEATSMPVGMVPGAPFSVRSIHLQKGDRIVLYTDGVTEAQNEAGELWGRARLWTTIRNTAEGSYQTCYNSLRSSLQDFTKGANQADDVTLVVLEYAAQ